jgi:hypothetical protein
MARCVYCTNKKNNLWIYIHELYCKGPKGNKSTSISNRIKLIESIGKDKLRIKDRHCVSCGKVFDIEVETLTGKLLTKCFYGGNIRIGGSYGKFTWKTDTNGDWIKDKDGMPKFFHTYPWYLELKFELIGLKRTLFHQYTDAEYIECGDCVDKYKLDILDKSAVSM